MKRIVFVLVLIGLVMGTGAARGQDESSLYLPLVAVNGEVAVKVHVEDCVYGPLNQAFVEITFDSPFVKVQGATDTNGDFFAAGSSATTVTYWGYFGLVQTKPAAKYVEFSVEYCPDFRAR